MRCNAATAQVLQEASPVMEEGRAMHCVLGFLQATVEVGWTTAFIEVVGQV